MRALLVLLLVLMVVFGAVQYNDPDGFVWIGIYAIPAIWCGLGAFRINAFRHKAVVGLFWASVLMCVIGVVYFWPITPRFWTREVWYNVETAREGMGLMIVLAVLSVVYFRIRKHASLPG